MQRTTTTVAGDSLSRYLSEINRHPLLSREEEVRLARRYSRTGDGAAREELINSNLRFVVKVAFEYRSYGLRMADLIQEGNIGLMRGVEKFDPNRGIRLISYAVWWIRAFIQNHILRSWSLVKLGTTQAQRRIFFSLAHAKRELARKSEDPPKAEAVAQNLRVKTAEVISMQQRIEGRDLSLDAPLQGEEGTTHLELVESSAPPADEVLAERETNEANTRDVAAALQRLDARERFIIERRLMDDRQWTFDKLGRSFGFSRERARQLELRAKAKLRAELCHLHAEARRPLVHEAA